MDVDQLIAGIGSAVVLAESQNNCSFPCMTKSEWASWAQAITAILGILVAVITFVVSSYHRRKERYVDNIMVWDRDRRIAEEMITQFSGSLKSVYNWLNPKNGGGRELLDLLYRKALLEGQCEKIKQLPLYVLTQSECQYSFLIQAHAQNLIAAMSMIDGEYFENAEHDIIIKEDRFLILDKIFMDKSNGAINAMSNIESGFNKERILSRDGFLQLRGDK
ncbi:hypothetical protein DR66_5988 [Delftia acidovorans]|uniref:hypothetical protein n=1 Tax=Delftia acidovorans TaxID=80866 RepID=UPI000505E17E|nr:hypothetical protein [Delftia acidovorans]KFJ08451.1 hypothetical protein DR66_5988 [Delftia acidovorans]QQB48363.1 hypothetical protein I6H54_18445 [Delftia acidovorans]